MCSLKEAFETFSTQGAEEPGLGMFAAPLYNADLGMNDGTKERRKKRRRRLLPPEPALVDPDRPANRPLPAAEELSETKAALTEPFDASLLTAPMTDDSYFPHPSSDVDDKTVYRLEPDWAKVFDVSTPQWIKDRVPPTNVASPLTPSPWTDGAATLWQSVPDTLRSGGSAGGAPPSSDSRLQELMRRMDRLDGLFADLEMSKTQSNHLELIMFVLAGLFLILLLDLLVKQGTAATLALANLSGNMTGGFLGGR
jgi:hypothetical protein